MTETVTTPLRKPNFFIVGAPKAGTTALAEYLGEHPSVFVSTPKEPFYFCQEFTGLPGPKSLEDYLALFGTADAASSALGEASAMYLYAPHAARNIHAFDPDAKIIVMLRNPVDIAHAFHSQLLHASSEDEPDFERAWELQETRATGDRLPPHVREPSFLQYRHVALLGEQVKRYLEVFATQQIHFIVFDEFVSDTARVYGETLEFLGVRHDGRRDFRRVNANKVNRNARLALFLNRPPSWASSLAGRVKRRLGISLGFLTPLRRLNVSNQSRTPLPAQFRRELADCFRDDIRQLSTLIGRDLSHWTV